MISFARSQTSASFPTPCLETPTRRVLVLSPFNVSTSNIIPFTSAGTPSNLPARSADRPMRSDLLEQAAQVVPDIPVLINMISQRVRQLNNGRPPLVRVYQRVGQADVALMEIIQGKIVLVEGSAEERF